MSSVSIKSHHNLEYEIVMYDSTAQSLRRVSFQGGDKCRASNFFRWQSLEEFFSDSQVIDTLSEVVLETLREEFFENDPVEDSFEIEFDQNVGWSYSDGRKKYLRSQLKLVAPTSQSRALAIRSDRTDLKAPLTNLVTIVFELLRGERTQVLVSSIYPGRDLGEFYGNITDKEKVVLFPMDHPGECLTEV